MDKPFYVYAHYNNEHDEFPFYVGKGKGNRAYNSTTRSDVWKQKASAGLVVKIVKDALTEEEAYSLESQLIEQYGRERHTNGKLVNISSGGYGGVSKLQVPPELLEQIKKHMFTVALQDYVSLGRLI